MKTTIAAFLFIVSWQEYELQPHQELYNGLCCETNYTVGVADHHMRFKTRKDVNIFIGHKTVMGFALDIDKYPKDGLINSTAFNIQVTEKNYGH